MSAAALKAPRGARPQVLRPSGDKRSPAPGAGPFGMAVFLVSLSMLFLAGLVAYLVVRARSGSWPPAGAPALPRTLWVGTLVLAACSVAIQSALVTIRRGDQRRLISWLWATNLLAATFLACQTVGWLAFYDAATFRAHLYGFTFYVLTGLHAAHVVGGLVALAVVTVFAHRRAYSWAHYPGVRNAAAYWHFLGGVWLVLYAVLLVG